MRRTGSLLPREFVVRRHRLRLRFQSWSVRSFSLDGFHQKYQFRSCYSAGRVVGYNDQPHPCGSRHHQNSAPEELIQGMWPVYRLASEESCWLLLHGVTLQSEKCKPAR